MLEHTSIQLDGADVIIRQSPNNSKPSAQAAILAWGGYAVNLFGRKHSFLIGNVVNGPFSAGRDAAPAYKSALYYIGKCALSHYVDYRCNKRYTTQ